MNTLIYTLILILFFVPVLMFVIYKIYKSCLLKEGEIEEIIKRKFK